MPAWKKVITSGSDATLNTLNVINGITGSLLGTASYAIYAETASSAQNASDILVYVKNSSGAQIDKGKVVRIIGAVGDNPLIATASYEDDANSANTLGITNETIPNDNFGYVITEGTLFGIDTSAFTAGQLIYLGATGSITGSAPVAPLHAVRLGEVLRVQAVVGSIYVRVDNGYELGELHDVRDTTTTASYGDLLVKSGSVWTNSKQLTGSYSITGSLTISGSSTFTNIGTTNLTGSVNITGSTTQIGTNTLIGRTIVSGSFEVTGSTNIPNITGSLLGTATTASYVLNAVSASFASTASYVLNAVSASFASTASFVNPLNQNVVITGSASNSLLVKGSGATSATSAILAQNSSGTTTFTVRDDGKVVVGSNSATTAPGKLTIFQGSSNATDGINFQLASNDANQLNVGAIATNTIQISSNGAGWNFAGTSLRNTLASNNTYGSFTMAPNAGAAAGGINVQGSFTDLGLTGGFGVAALAGGNSYNDSISMTLTTAGNGNAPGQSATLYAGRTYTISGSQNNIASIVLNSTFNQTQTLSSGSITGINHIPVITSAYNYRAFDFSNTTAYTPNAAMTNYVWSRISANISASVNSQQITGLDIILSGSNAAFTGVRRNALRLATQNSSDNALTAIGTVIITGSLNVTGGVTGSFSGVVTSASFATNADTLDGLDSADFVQTSTDQNITGEKSFRNTTFFGLGSGAGLDGKLTLVDGTNDIKTSLTVDSEGNIIVQDASNVSLATIYQNGDGISLASGTFTGNLTGNADTATTASFASTASFVRNAVSSSFASTASFYGGSVTSASFATTASYVNPLSQNVVITGSASNSLLVRGSGATSATNAFRVENSAGSSGLIVNDVGKVAIGTNITPNSSNVYDLTTSYIIATYMNNSRYDIAGVLFGSYPGGGIFNIGESGWTGRVNYSTFNILSNVGINKTSPNARLDVSGSVIITGSLNVTAGITGSLLGTSSYATQALSASYAPPSAAFPYVGAANISGSLTVTGSVSITGSLQLNQLSLTKTSFDTISSGATIDTSCNETLAQFRNFRSMHIKYNIQDASGGNYRAGNIVAITNGTGTVQYTETTTMDIGNTAAVILSVIQTNGNQNLTLNINNGLGNSVDLVTEYTML